MCQRAKIKHFLQDSPQWWDSRKKHNIQGDIRTLLGKECEVEKMMRFLREKKYRDDRRPMRSANVNQCLLVIDDFDTGQTH